MNDLVVLQATQGLARYACEGIEGAKERGVVVGHDHREFGGMSSKRFAELAAGVFRREGMKVYFFEGLVHTPMVVRCKTRVGSRGKVADCLCSLSRSRRLGWTLLWV